MSDHTRVVWCDLCHQHVEELQFGVLECGHHEDDLEFVEEYDQVDDERPLNFDDTRGDV